MSPRMQVLTDPRALEIMLVDIFPTSGLVEPCRESRKGKKTTSIVCAL